MGIVQEILLHQSFKISFTDKGFQFFEHRKSLYLGEGFLIVIQPGSENSQAVHQSFGVGGKISFPVTEFHAVDPGLQSFPVDPVSHNISKSTADNGNKLLLPVRLCPFCHNLKIWLQDAVAVGTVNIHTDARVQKRFFQRRSRRA